MTVPRYVLIDRETGYIGDTADFADFEQSSLTPTRAAALLDVSLHEPPNVYRETGRTDANATYDVFRTDGDGRETTHVVFEDADRDIIDAVERRCEYVTSLIREDPQAGNSDDRSLHSVEFESFGGKWVVRVTENCIASVKVFELKSEAHAYAEREGQRLGVRCDPLHDANQSEKTPH
jgi:hypothetical protein